MQRNLLSKLQNQFSNAIQSATTNKTELDNAPLDLKPIFGEYFSLLDCINIRIIDGTASNGAPQFPIKINTNEMRDFVKEIVNRFKSENREIFTKMIKIFFSNASLEDQGSFFSLLGLSIDGQEGLEDDEDTIHTPVVIEVLRAIPEDAPHLNFNRLNHPYNDEISSLIMNSNSLKTLYLPNNFFEEEKNSSFLRNLTNLTQLSTLKADFIDFEALEHIINNPNIKLTRVDITFNFQRQTESRNISQMLEKLCSNNLEELVLGGMYVDPDILNIIVNSNARDTIRLLGLNFTKSASLFDFTIGTILRASFPKIEKFEFKYNCFTDTTVDKLIKHLTDKTSGCTYRDTLQYVDFSNCQYITKEALDRLENVLEKNRKRESLFQLSFTPAGV